MLTSLSPLSNAASPRPEGSFVIELNLTPGHKGRASPLCPHVFMSYSLSGHRGRVGELL